MRAIACRRGAAGVDCDGLAIDDCDRHVIDFQHIGNLIVVCLEVGDRHGAGQARHCDHAVVVGDCEVVVGRKDINGVRLTIAAAGRPCPQVDGDLLHAGSGQILDRDVVGELALSIELDALDTGEIDGAADTGELRPPPSRWPRW